MGLSLPNLGLNTNWPKNNLPACANSSPSSSLQPSVTNGFSAAAVLSPKEAVLTNCDLLGIITSF